MAGEDVLVTIGVDASAANTALASSRAKFGEWSKGTSQDLTRVETAAAKTTKAVTKVAAPIDHAAASAAKLRAESENLEKVASLLGPNIGNLVSQMSKLGKVSGSGIGGATLAIAGLAAGLGAGLYAMSAYASMVADTVENVDDLAASLDVVTRDRLASQITSLRNSKTALDDAAGSWTELKIVLADVADGPLADMVTLVSAIAEGWALIGINAKRAGIDVTSAIPYVGSLIKDLERLAELKGLVDQYYAKPDTSGPIGSTNYSSDELAALLGMPTGNATTTAPKPAVPAAQPRATGNRPAASGPGAIESSMFLAGITIPKSQIDLRAAGLAAVAELDQQYADKKAALDKQAADEAIAQIERETAARKAAVQNAIAGASAVTSSLIAFGMQTVDAQVANTKEGTEAHRQALRDQLTMQEASAAAQAALGIVNIWSQWAAQPIVAAALTLVEGAAVTGAITQMERQKSKLHTGGLAPDEQYGMPQAITRTNERSAVLTREGQRHLNELDRINAGAVGAGQVLQVVVRDESGRRMSGRQFGTTQPAVGFAPRAVRNS